MPRFDGIGANEYIVDVTHDAVDFISTVDTPAPWELNIWYHTLNGGFRTRISGETDFPCIYGERVGLGRSYVKLDARSTTTRWAEGIRDGRAYVTDGKSHLIDFRVDDVGVGTRRQRAAARRGRGTVQRDGAGRRAPRARAERRRSAALPLRREAVLGPRAGADRRRRARCRSRSIVNGRVAATRGTSPPTARVRDLAFDVADRAQQLGRAAHPAVVAHQPGVRAGRRQADPRLARERRVVPAGGRPVLVAEGAEDRRAGEGGRRGRLRARAPGLPAHPGRDGT